MRCPYCLVKDLEISLLSSYHKFASDSNSRTLDFKFIICPNAEPNSVILVDGYSNIILGRIKGIGEEQP